MYFLTGFAGGVNLQVDIGKVFLSDSLVMPSREACRRGSTISVSCWLCAAPIFPCLARPMENTNTCRWTAAVKRRWHFQKEARLMNNDEWPGGLNLATTPAIWRTMFDMIPSPYFGLNYDPSHLVWQRIDYLKPIYEFKDRIFHVHFKDIKVYKGKLDRVGIMATPLEYLSPKLPGLG